MSDYENLMSPCGICDQVIDRPYIRLPDADRRLPEYLHQYVESPVHQDCLIQWEYRAAFSKPYFEADVQSQNPIPSHILLKTDAWVLICGQRGPHIKPDMKKDFAKLMLQIGGLRKDTADPFYAYVRLRDWPFRLYSQWPRWTEYVNGGYRQGFIPEIQIVVDEIMAEVRAIVPTLEALRQLLNDKT